MIQFTTKQLVNHEDVVGRQLALLELKAQELTGEELDRVRGEITALNNELTAIQRELDYRFEFRQGRA